MKFKALILDMDGTLLDSTAMVWDSLKIFAEQRNISLTPEQFQNAIGNTSDKFMASLGVPDPIGEAEAWREMMAGMLDRVTLFDGVQEVLESSVRRGVVTSQTRQELTANMDRLGIEEYFECTVTVDDTPYQKPHPAPLLHCLEQMGLSADEALFVGDSHYDYDCARAAGVTFGLAMWSGSEGKDFPEAAYLFRRPEEMLSLVAPVERMY